MRRRVVFRSLAAIGALGVLAAWSPGGGRAAAIIVTLHPDQTFQAIRSFGASDAWSVQFLGAYWPAEQRTRAADLLFSTADRPDGSPVGIAPGARTHRVYRTTNEPGVNLQFTGTIRSDQVLTVPARSFTTLVSG